MKYFIKNHRFILFILIIIFQVCFGCAFRVSQQPNVLKQPKDTVLKSIECRILSKTRLEILSFTYFSVFFVCVDIEIVEPEELRASTQELILQSGRAGRKSKDRIIFPIDELWKPIGTQLAINVWHDAESHEFYFAGNPEKEAR